VSQPYVYTIDTPTNQQFVHAFGAKYGRDPGISAESTYVALAAIHQALRATEGKIENKPKFLEALRQMDLEAPRGHIRFDHYQNVVTNVTINRIEKVGDQIVPVVVEIIPEVDQFLGMSPEEYLKSPRLIALKGTFGK
jgi:branched-chain amino acid transport system substrate-binding protein